MASRIIVDIRRRIALIPPGAGMMRTLAGAHGASLGGLWLPENELCPIHRQRPTLFQMTSTATHATAHHWRDELHAPARPRTRRSNPLTTTDFDIYAALDDVLAETRGISRAEAGGSVHFTGADPIVPSAMSSAGLLYLPL
jgi:hypothetical protein